MIGTVLGPAINAMHCSAILAEEKLKASTRSSVPSQWVPLLVSQVWPLIRMQDRTNVGVVGACLVDRFSVKSAHRSKTVARGPVNGILYPLSANTLKRVRHSKWSRPHTQTTSGCVEAKYPDVGCGAIQDGRCYGEGV